MILDGEDRGGEGFVETFVAIEAEDPVVAGLSHGEVLLLHVAEEGLFEDFVGVFGGDFAGTVGAQGIDHDDFVCDGQEGLEAVLDPGLFVVGDDAGGDFGHGFAGIALGYRGLRRSYIGVKFTGVGRLWPVR